MQPMTDYQLRQLHRLRWLASPEGNPWPRPASRAFTRSRLREAVGVRGMRHLFLRGMRHLFLRRRERLRFTEAVRGAFGAATNGAAEVKGWWRRLVGAGKRLLQEFRRI